MDIRFTGGDRGALGAAARFNNLTFPSCFFLRKNFSGLGHSWVPINLLIATKG
jgi:hypothetical protein